MVDNALTTAPYSTNNQINPFSQLNVQDIDDAVNTVQVGALLPFKNRPGASPGVQVSQQHAAVNGALAGLQGKGVINAGSSVITNDPTTYAPTATTGYTTRYPGQQFIINNAVSVT